jgi:hypothetical protein
MTTLRIEQSSIAEIDVLPAVDVLGTLYHCDSWLQDC